MKVAIIGAGVAGLSCALTLESMGISPIVYERNSFIGEKTEYTSCLLSVIHKPIREPLLYIQDHFNIHIQPITTLNRIIHHSPNRTATIKGNLGYIIKRGKSTDALNNQLFSQLKNTKILFDESCDYKNIMKSYDYVVIANGFHSFTNELGCWQTRQQACTRGAVVTGNFDPNTMVVWLNKGYCKNGYAYLLPVNDKKASLVLIVTDVNDREVDHYWESFLYTEKINYIIVEEFKKVAITGHVFPHKVDNILFAGDAGGAPDSFLGFGQFNSIFMGVMAARTIVEGKDYEMLVREISNRNDQLYQFRKLLNTMTNQDYDRMISLLGKPGVRHVIYNTPMNVRKYGAKLLQMEEKI